MIRTSKKINIGLSLALMGLLLMLSFAVINLNVTACFASNNEISSQEKIQVEFINGISTSTEVRVIKPGDIKVYINENKKRTETKNFILEDDIVAPKRGDYTITVLVGNERKLVTAAINPANKEMIRAYYVEALDNNTVEIQTITDNNLNLKINSSYVEIIEDAFTESDLNRLFNGEVIRLKLEIELNNEEGHKNSKAGQVISSLLNSKDAAYYFGIRLVKVYESGQEEEISSLNNPIEFTIDIPKTLIKKSRSFNLVASHSLADGTIETFTLKDLDNSDNSYTISTNKFCTMALVYADEENVTSTIETSTNTTSNVSLETPDPNEIIFNTPKTSDGKLMGFIVAFAISIILLYIAFIRHEIREN